MGKKLRRKPCDGTKCQAPAFFHRQRAPAGDPFFPPTAGASDAPVIQKQDAPDAPKEEKKKDPMVEGLKVTGEQLFEHEPFKLWFEKWYEPQLDFLKTELWEKSSPGEKALLVSFAGVNLGVAGLAFAQSPEFRSALSGVGIGAPLGWIPYSPIKGFKYELPEGGKTGTRFSADFTLDPYLGLLHKRFPRFPWTGATLGLESRYDPAGGGFGLGGGKLGLDFLGSAVKAQGSIFDQSTISPYPLMVPGAGGMGPSWIMKEFPGMPDMKTGPGFQGTLSLDFMKMPWFRRWLGERNKE